MTWKVLTKSSLDTAKYRVGDLRDPRPQVKHAFLVTWAMKMSILYRVSLLVFFRYGSWLNLESSLLTIFPDILFEMWTMQAEMITTVLLFGWLARWEDQEHWITLWQTLYTLEILLVRHALYNDAALLSCTFLGLYLTYFVGVYAEFTKWELPRVPPFPDKKHDTTRPRYGWLGKSLSRKFTWKFSRMVLTAFFYLAGVAYSIFMVYAFFISDVDDLRNLPIYKLSEHKQRALAPVMIVAVIATCVSLIPPLLCEAGMIPGLIRDLFNFKRASRSYRTGVWDICELDEDKDGPGPELRRQMQEKALLDTTIVLPCYLPNEEDILPFVLEHYFKQFELLAQYELSSHKCQKNILLVWNSPDTHPKFNGSMAEWKSKFAAHGFGLEVLENKNSTSKCDNLNLACDHIKTEVCCLNDADTMLDWSCIARGALHISNGYDIAQAMNTHCDNDRRGTPGDDVEKQCHMYGILITVGDATKPQNMSTQTPFKHSPFNGRGGFWKTSSLKKVGFDHRTVGEDHDAGYRGCAYFGMKGILDMNMLCQEQEPPDCKSLTSQRIRWETAALEMRRTFSWILRSPHYGRFETFVLLWGQLQQNCNLPFQAFPFQIATALPLIVLKGWVNIFAFGETSDAHFCTKRHCMWEFPVTNPFTGNDWNVALPLPLVILACAMAVFILANAVDFCLRVLTTRYRPRCMFFVYYGLLKPLCVQPYFMYVQYWALYDYCWGGAKFIATARSPLSPKKEENNLEKPLLPK